MHTKYTNNSTDTKYTNDSTDIAFICILNSQTNQWHECYIMHSVSSSNFEMEEMDSVSSWVKELNMAGEFSCFFMPRLKS